MVARDRHRDTLGGGLRKFYAPLSKRSQKAEGGGREFRLLPWLFLLGFRGRGKILAHSGVKNPLAEKGEASENGRGDMVPVRAAIEHDDEDPEAGEFRAKIEEDFKDFLFKNVYAHQIPPKM